MQLTYLWRPVIAGRQYCYYRRGGRYVRIDGKIGSPGWLQSYLDIHAAFDAGDARPGRADRLVDVVREYQASRKWRRLAATTQANYQREIDALLLAWGTMPAGAITRGMIIAMRDQLDDLGRPRAALERVKVVRLLLGHAHDLDLISTNQAAGIGQPIGYQPTAWREWTPAEIETFEASAAPRWRRAVMLLRFTGLRVGDAVRVQRSDIAGGAIRWTVHKTNTPVVIPLHRTIAGELAGKADSLFLMPALDGRPFKHSRSVSSGVKAEARRVGILDPPPLHGLRRNAVMALLQAGCSKAEVRAITGQSDRMIDHYGAAYDREGQARAAITKLEAIT